jgi:hypothetical protein
MLPPIPPVPPLAPVENPEPRTQNFLARLAFLAFPRPSRAVILLGHTYRGSGFATIAEPPQWGGARLWGLTTKSEEHTKRPEYENTFRAPNFFCERSLAPLARRARLAGGYAPRPLVRGEPHLWGLSGERKEHKKIGGTGCSEPCQQLGRYQCHH